MRILMINVVCGIKSTGRICTDLASALQNDGHEVMIAYGRGMVPEKYKHISVKIGSTFDVYKQALLSRVFDCEGFGNSSATKNIINWIKDYRPELIHLHNLHGYYLNCEMLFSFLKEYKKPVIWTLHDCWSFTGHCAYFDYIQCEKWMTCCKTCPGRNNYPTSYILDRSKENYQRKLKAFTGVKNLTVVTPSRWLAKLVKKSYLKDYPVTIIPNGINTDVFKPRKSDLKKRLGIENKIMILGVAAIWDRRKGLDSFIELSYKLTDEYVIVLIGLTKHQIGCLPQNILGIESTNNTIELAEYYSVADVFVNPTLEDNYPTTNLEAIACGTPVITYDTGGSPESANIFGKTVNQNIDDLIDAIKFYKDFSKPSRLSIDTIDMLNNYMKLYNKVRLN